MIRLAGLILATACTVGIGAAAPPAHAEAALTCPAVAAEITVDQRDRAWQVAAERLAALSGPATYPFGATGSAAYRRTNAYAWTSGFYPSALWLMYEHTSDSAWLQRARAYTRGVLPVATWTGTHDLGFMVGTPAWLGMQSDPDVRRSGTYARALVRASRSLSSRWNSRVQAIRSGEYGGRWGLIIDSAMNAPMLLRAGHLLGGAQGRALSSRGLRHMLTLSRHFIRPDGSTRHRLAFDPRTGRLIGPVYGQGLSTSSTWSRGQAWAIDGFAQAYQLTRDARLLDAARRTADFWITRVPIGCVPAWDLDATGAGEPRDSSAAAIAAHGLLLLADADPDTARAAGYRHYALTALGTLAGEPWLTGSAGGRGVLQRQAYNVPADPREGTYAWGDAFLLAALAWD